MRPGISRSFSTTRRIAQQQLFEPYIPELNERQRAALRKAARANEPHYHGTMNKDALWLLTAYNRSASQTALLNQTRERLRDIVKQHAGPNCDVEDIGMHTYSRPLHDAPFEFAIVDKTRPNGVSPEENAADLPIVYDASRFSEILMQEGFMGGFWAPPWDMGSIPGHMMVENPLPPTRRDLTIPWPKYRRPSIREFHYPVRMITYSPVAFSLTLPGPSVMRLHELIKSYFKMRETMTSLLTMLFIWTRSHGMDEFTTQCLALLVIRYMQEIGKAPNMMDPDHPLFKVPKYIKKFSRTQSQIWVPYQYHVPHPDGEKTRECRVEPRQLEHTIMISHSLSSLQKKPGSLLYEFLAFWRDAILISRTYALSVGQNKYLKRQLNPLKQREQITDMARIFDSTEKMAIADHGFNPTLTEYDPRIQSFSWRLHALIVQDPFIPTYNHAESVSRETMQIFARHAQTASRQLSHGWPYMTSFGKSFIPYRENAAITFMKKRGRVRGYHSDGVRPMLERRPEATEPPEYVLKARASTIRHVQYVIRAKYGAKYRVEAFGSTEYGVSTASSDLDLVIIDPTRMSGFSPEVKIKGLPDIYNVKKLAVVLRKAGLTRILAIPTANVPIVKFTDKKTGLDCDINVNEQLGRLNTGMIKRYCDIVPILRPMFAFIKSWAKPLGLNSPAGGKGGPSPTFSSYSLMLMTISYLQSRGLAPNLQSGFEHHSDAPGSYFWIRKTSKSGDAKRIRCDTRYHLGNGWAAKESVNYKEALAGWFQYWGNEHSYSTCIVSIRQDGFVSKEPETQIMPKSASIPVKQLEEVQKSLDDMLLRVRTLQLHSNSVNEIQNPTQTVHERDESPAPSVTQEGLCHAAAGADSRMTQKLVADKPVSDEHGMVLDADNLSPADPAPESVSNDTPDPDIPTDEDINNISKSFAEVLRNDLWKRVQAGSPQSRPKQPRKQQARGLLRFPLCVVDPFIRDKVVTKSISRATIKNFQRHCQLQSWEMNLEFEEAAVNPKLKKVTKKNPKIPDELAAYLPSSPPLAVSRLRDDDTEADVDPAKICISFTPQTMQQYPGAVAGGSDGRPSPTTVTDQIFIDDDDEAQAEDMAPLDFMPGPPDRELPEFEPEGFGLKRKYYEGEVSSHEDTTQESVEFQRSDEVVLNGVIPPTDTLGPSGQMEADTTAADQDYLDPVEPGTIPRVVDAA